MNISIFNKDTSYIKAAWICIISASLFRLWFSGQFLLAPDETNYWQWGRHLAWGYHDQAPMIGWMIRFFTHILGNTETAVRLPSVFAVAVVSIYLMKIANVWFGPKIAFNTVLLSQSILELNVGGILATPDGLQAAAWAGASYHVAKAYKDHTWSQWLLGGLWFGFGMLSKFTMVIFPLCVYLFGLLFPVHRNRLKTVKPYAGVVLGLMLFSPVVFWNAANNWNSLRHVAFIGGANEPFTLQWKYLVDFIASQAGLISPATFILVLLAWVLTCRKEKNTGQWIYSYLFFTSLPMVSGFTFLSLHTQIYGNWPGAGYLTASVLVAALFSVKSSPYENARAIRFGNKIWPWAIGISYMLTILVLMQVVFPVMPLPINRDRTSTEIQGWMELGQTIAILKKHMPHPEKTFLFGFRYQIASELAFYTPDQPETVSINKWNRPNVYDYWTTDEKIMGWDAIGVTESQEYHFELLQKVFDRVEPPEKLNIYRHHIWTSTGLNRKPVKTFYIYRAYGFKGGLRWVPSNKQDIRAYPES